MKLYLSAENIVLANGKQRAEAESKLGKLTLAWREQTTNDLTK
jgi:hypothetical protein